MTRYLGSNGRLYDIHASCEAGYEDLGQMLFNPLDKTYRDFTGDIIRLDGGCSSHHDYFITHDETYVNSELEHSIWDWKHEVLEGCDCRKDSYYESKEFDMDCEEWITDDIMRGYFEWRYGPGVFFEFKIWGYEHSLSVRESDLYSSATGYWVAPDDLDAHQCVSFFEGIARDWKNWANGYAYVIQDVDDPVEETIIVGGDSLDEALENADMSNVAMAKIKNGKVRYE